MTAGSANPITSRAWSREAIARRVRDEAMLRAIRRGHATTSRDLQLPKWLRDAERY